MRLFMWIIILAMVIFTSRRHRQQRRLWKQKAAFERHCQILGCKVKHYLTDKGIFASKAWKDACEQSRQSFTYSGVNAHFQSGVAERHIRELQEIARACLLHAQHCWKEAVNPHLWPYAIRIACAIHNEAPTKRLKRCPCEVFSGAKVKPNPAAWVPFGCLVYVLDDALQNNRQITGKWKHRSQVGVYLGWSPLHALSVALVLSLTTGQVSPQFHVQFDPTFQTMKASFGG
jgi:hypothetical protein